MSFNLHWSLFSLFVQVMVAVIRNDSNEGRYSPNSNTTVTTTITGPTMIHTTTIDDNTNIIKQSASNNLNIEYLSPNDTLHNLT